MPTNTLYTENFPHMSPAWSRIFNFVAEHAEGSYIYTEDGRKLLDFTCGIGVTNTGHAHPRVVAAIAEQAARGIHLQQNIVYHEPGLELHRRLPARFPNATPGERYGAFLSNSGAEAIEAAVKLAKYVTRRPNVIAFRGGFHGRTHAAMALTSSSAKYRAHFEPLMPGELERQGKITPKAQPAIRVTMAPIVRCRPRYASRVSRARTNPRSQRPPNRPQPRPPCRKELSGSRL